MIDWTDEQRDAIWKLYTDQQLTFLQISERYTHLGATRSAIAGLIHRMHQARDQEVDNEIKGKVVRKLKPRSGTYGGYNTTRKNAPLTPAEIQSLKDAQKR